MVAYMGQCMQQRIAIAELITQI